jgi:hypothetical protein
MSNIQPTRLRRNPETNITLEDLATALSRCVLGASTQRLPGCTLASLYARLCGVVLE